MRNNFNDELIKREASDEAPVEQSVGRMEFIHAIESVDLPSKGLFYAEDHPLYKKESVEIKHMTTKEEDILTNKSYIKKGIVIDKLLESLLVDKKIKVSSLLVGDKNALIIKAREVAYGPDYEVSVSCRHCGEKNLLNFDLTTCEDRNINVVLDDPDLKDVNILDNQNFFIKLPKTGWEIQCKLMNGEDEKIIVAVIESKKRQDADADLKVSEQLSYIIQSLNGDTNKDLIESALEFMPASDSRYLRKIYQKIIPNVVMKKQFACVSCYMEQEMEVPFTQEFFWPK